MYVHCIYIYVVVIMKVHLITILLICIEQFTKAVGQGMPISPCPKIFQYRFDGNEWFGLIAVRNPDEQAALQIRVTLSMRGKPTTNYLGEIELLTRGQFTNNAPVLYKIRFPKLHFPPKLVLISANNKAICFGSADHSIFMTQIQLEHTRKLTFIPNNESPGLLTPTHLDSGLAVGKEMPAKHEFGSKPLPHIQFKKKPFHSPREICGKTDKNIDFRMLQRMKRKIAKNKSKDERANGKLRFNVDDVNQSPSFVSFGDYDIDGNEDDLDVVELDENESVDSSLFDVKNSTADNILPSITRGAWPWLAAIYVNNLTSLDFQCGGTLVSSRVVISSAHCFQMFNQRYTANEVLVFLGRHNLKNWNEEGSLAAPVDGIYIHPDFNKQLSNYDADIAVVILKDQVRFNTFIQPVCLWSGSSKTEYIVGEHGIVIGWSFNKTNRTILSKGSSSSSSASTRNDSENDGSIPTVIRAPIVANDDCFTANEHFRSLSSNRTFCAGILTSRASSHKKSGRTETRRLYTGISGAGLMILRNNRWMLRGTVSAALPSSMPKDMQITDSAAHCCTSQYIIYADVAKFIDWIMAFII